MDKLNGDHSDEEELKIFEMMEKIAEKPNLGSNSAVINDFMKTRLNLSPDLLSHRHLNSNGSTSRGLELTRMNSNSMSSVASSSCSTTSENKCGNYNHIPDNVLGRVLEQVRNDSEKFNHIMSESGGQKGTLDVQGALLTARRMELEEEIKKFRQENKNVLALRAEWQAKFNELENDRTQHEQLKTRELRLIEEEKARIDRKKERLAKLYAEYDAKTDKLENSLKETENEVREWKCKLPELNNEIRSMDSQFSKVKSKLQEEIAALQDKIAKLTAENEKLRTLPKQNKVRQLHQSVQTSTSSSANTPDSSQSSTAVAAPIFYNMPASQASASVSVPIMLINSSTTSTHNHEASLKEKPNEEDKGIERILPNGDVETRYSNGTSKLVSKDLQFTRVMLTNGDIREALNDGTVRYFYNESSSWHTTYPDGMEVVEFPSGQIERKSPNGVLEIMYTNGCIKHIYPDGKEECLFPDKTVLRTERNGDKVLLMTNGQKEYETKDFRKRTYPDGTVKILYSDGSQETRYPNGRVRMKNSDGKLIHDAIHHTKEPQI